MEKQGPDNKEFIDAFKDVIAKKEIEKIAEEKKD